MKKIFKILGIILIIIIAWLLLFNFIYFYKTHQFNRNSLLGGVEVPSMDEIMDVYKTTDSDIEGMTQYDKYLAGLYIEDGSDTDHDGLTDKEELEVYGSDPLKDSTAGDLYSDKYKVDNGLDLFTYYEYNGPYDFEFNECSNVKIVPSRPNDFKTVVKDVTFSEKLAGYEILREYNIYNTSGVISIDVSSLNIPDKKLDVYYYEKGEIQACPFLIEDSNITLSITFDSLSDYNIYIVKKSMWGKINSKFNPKFLDRCPYDVSNNNLFYFGSPLLTLLGNKLTFYYTDSIESGFDSSSLKGVSEKMGLDINSTSTFVKKTGVEIESLKTVLQHIVPFFECNSKEEMRWYHLIFLFYSDSKKNVKCSETGFDIKLDSLPFKNFGSYISHGGNCTGISHLTTVLYNTGSISSKGEYAVDINDDGIRDILQWDISKDEENATLMNPYLNDYKSSSFVNKHSFKIKKCPIHSKTCSIIDYDSLSEGEKQFVNMIGCFWREGNDNCPPSLWTVKGTGQNPSYQTIVNLKEKLDQGEIVTFFFGYINGEDKNEGWAHSVNIYDYLEDAIEPDITWFKLYDNNSPGISINMRVKKKVIDPEDTTFSYDVSFLYDEAIGTSLIDSNDLYLFVIYDEKWNLLNE